MLKFQQEMVTPQTHVTIYVTGRVPLPEQERGACLTLGKWIVGGDTKADKARALLWWGAWAESRRIRGPRTALPHSLGFMVMGLISGCLANQSDSGSFWVARIVRGQDELPERGFWDVVGPVASPFNLYRILVGGGLLGPCSYQDLLS